MSPDPLKHAPDDSLVAWVEGRLGHVDAWHSHSWSHGESEVWEAVTDSGARAFLKCHRQRRKFIQERGAYERWTRVVGETPTLIDVRNRGETSPPDALLLSAVPGEPLLTARVDPERQPSIYARAGSWLRKLHALPHTDHDALTIPEALTARVRAWVVRADGMVERSKLKEIERIVTAPWPVTAGSSEALPRRVPCHRDFTMRNWLVKDDFFHVVDFEHSRADWSLVDLERVLSSLPPGPTATREAFLEGYGGPPVDLGSLHRITTMSALSRVVWAVEHGDTAFEASGRQQLADALDAPRPIS